MERQPISPESKTIKKARSPRNLPNLVRGVGLSIMLASEIACAHESTTPTNDTLTTTPSTSETPAWITTPTPIALSPEISTPEYTDILNKYYPELIKSGLPAKDQMTVTKNSKNSTIINYTEYPLNVDSAYAIVYDILESFARDSQAKINYPLNDKERIFVIRPRHEVKNRILLLIPANAPRPASWKNINNLGSQYSAATQLVKDGALSYVQLTTERANELFPNVDQMATNGFAVEACQQVVNTTVLDTKGKEIKDLEEKNLAQEIFCNSFGIAIAARLLGIPYDEYRSFVTMRILNLGSADEYRLLTFDNNAYSKFPITGGILK